MSVRWVGKVEPLFQANANFSNDFGILEIFLYTQLIGSKSTRKIFEKMIRYRLYEEVNTVTKFLSSRMIGPLFPSF